ncbi:aldehyde oxidase 3-like [Lampris incognitus]|uniref:aldehyde oxidase 3-like n=1 Tax=Lampris incognitus TaxID=2546036 RepID=UPI0024B61D4A|nr:aldehyde oxidase 3-like [Lampris incognitus]
MAEQKKSDRLYFFVNGNKVTEDHADPETTLLTYLREKLKLTGTKRGCGGGGCGTCTVMVSKYQPSSKEIVHFAANSCLLFICQVHGAAITTVEGIGDTKTRIHPVQEHIAKAHGSQCGFCTPGFVMSMYTLLRNEPQPKMDNILEALSGNLCRCTGYRPILDGCRTFCQESNCCQNNGDSDSCLSKNENIDKLDDDAPKLFNARAFAPLDPTQELIFPPELIRLETENAQETLTFRGERVTWVSPVSLEELVQLRKDNPDAPLVFGCTIIGPLIKFRRKEYAVMISPMRVHELFTVTHTPDGVWVGAGLTMSEVKSLLQRLVEELPFEMTELFRALVQQIGQLAGPQIRNVASFGGNIASARSTSDVNPILAVGNCTLRVVSAGETREIPVTQMVSAKEKDLIISVFLPHTTTGELVRAFRQAPRKCNAFATIIAGMRVLFNEGTREVQDLRIYWGGFGPTPVGAPKTCATIIGRLWDDETLSQAYDVLLEEFSTISSNEVHFRRSLMLSLLFKFHLEVQHRLREMDLPVFQNVITDDLPAAMQSGIKSLPKDIQPGIQEFQGVPEDQAEWDSVGHPIMHRSALSQATGEAVYCDDLPIIDNELFMVVVTSDEIFATLTDIDVTQARNARGVADVITSRDIPGKKVRTLYGYKEELLAENKVLLCVSCYGQMVCAVVADSMTNAKRAAALVKITYEKLPNPVFTVEEAIEREEFFEPRRRLERGDVEEAFANVDHVYEGEIRIGGQDHFYMETQSMLVVPVGEEREFNVFISCQWPSLTQQAVAETLDIPLNRVTCHVKRMGGAFGGKLTKTTILACITAVAAWKTKRAVRCVLTRGEDMLITGGRHPVIGKYKVGYMDNGKILAAEVEYCANAGNTVDESPAVIEKMICHCDNAYNIPNLRASGSAYKTNMPSNTSCRGFGVPQGILVIENMISDVACKLGRPADQIREINMYNGPSLTHYKFPFDSENLQLCWEECKKRSNFRSRCWEVSLFNQRNRWKKKGISLIPIKFGVGFSESFLNQAGALVHIYKDGSVLVSHCGAEMGQGIHTKMQQVASKELGVPLSKVHISETSTAAVPNDGPSAASFGTDANGEAVKLACQTLYRRLEPIRQQSPNSAWELWIDDAYKQKISLSATGYHRGPDSCMKWDEMEGQPYPYFTYGVCCSEVELDCLTGDYMTLRTDLVLDIGRSINPSVDIGQIEGAFMLGLGLYTTEKLNFSKGKLYSWGPSQYHIPAVCDMPLQFNVYLLPNSTNPHAIYSSKGVGEPSLFLGSSVFFAIKDAVAAARVDSSLFEPFRLDSPSTPENSCVACATSFTQKVPVNNDVSRNEF